MFVAEGARSPLPISAMPGQSQHSLESLVATAGRAVEVGVPGVLLFGIPSHKDAEGSQAYARDGITQRAIAALKDAYGEKLLVIADLCMCEYTDHGHCGVLTSRGSTPYARAGQSPSPLAPPDGR
jgi:porphobilinogen synthase